MESVRSLNLYLVSSYQCYYSELEIRRGTEDNSKIIFLISK